MVILEGYEAIGAGLTLGLSSILSIGPNNMMLMREGLRRGQVGWVATAVWLSYLAFFACAFLLAERLSIGGAVMQPILAWSASLVICWFAFRSFRSAFVSDASLKLGVGQRDATVDRVRRAVVAVWLNPLTYVDKFMMPSGCQHVRRGLATCAIYERARIYGRDLLLWLHFRLNAVRDPLRPQAVFAVIRPLVRMSSVLHRSVHHWYNASYLILCLVIFAPNNVNLGQKKRSRSVTGPL